MSVAYGGVDVKVGYYRLERCTELAHNWLRAGAEMIFATVLGRKVKFGGEEI